MMKRTRLAPLAAALALFAGLGACTSENPTSSAEYQIEPGTKFLPVQADTGGAYETTSSDSTGSRGGHAGGGVGK